MPKNSFQIVNTGNGVGQHWITFAKDKHGKLHFGDSMGNSLSTYPLLRKYNKQTFNKFIKSQVQQTPDLCGLFAIYFAFLILQERNTSSKNMSEHELFRFVNKYYNI